MQMQYVILLDWRTEATGDFAPLMEIDMTWGDVFVMTTHPAISAEEGLKIGPEVMARAKA
jgi:hypothetical protein